MKGRLENKIKTEQRIDRMIADMPEYMHRYYYSISLKTHKTKERYIENVIRFLNVYGNGETVSLEMLNKVDAFVIQKYISSISYYKKDGSIMELSNSSKACNISCLSSFFRFLTANGFIKKNPFDGGAIDRPKPQEKEVVFLSKDEVKKVEKAILDGVGTKRSVARQKNWKYRDFCLFWLPVINGIRVGALSEINIEDIDFNDNSILVVEKGDRITRIYFNDKAALYLKLWIEQRKEAIERCEKTRENSGNSEDYEPIDYNALFISNTGSRITVTSIERIIEKYTEGAIGRHISPHKLRATFATHLYGETRDIELTSKALHHKSTTPTQKYVKVFDQDIRNAVNIGLYN